MNTNDILKDKSIISKIILVATDFYHTAYAKQMEFLAKKAIVAIESKNAFNITSFNRYTFKYFHKTQKEIEFLKNFLDYAKMHYEKTLKVEKKELLDIQNYYKHIVDTEKQRKILQNKQTGRINIW